MAIDLEKLDQNFSNKFGGIAGYIDKNFNVYRKLGVTNLTQCLARAYEWLFNLLLAILLILAIPASYFAVSYCDGEFSICRDISWGGYLFFSVIIYLLIFLSLVLVFGLFATIISANSYLRKIYQNTTIENEQQFQVIVSCPNCKQKTRVPANKELEITCPSCKNEWVEKT